MPNVWPPSLPQYQLADLTEKESSNIVEFAVSNGPTKRRRTSTKNRVFQTTNIQITGTQLATLIDFYDDTLSGGISTFEWTDFITDVTATFRFVSRPNPQLIVPAPLAANRLYECTIELERM